MSTDLLEQEQNPAQQDWDTKVHGSMRHADTSPGDQNITAASEAERAVPSATSARMAGPSATADLSGSSKRDKSMLFTKKITPFLVLVAIFIFSLGGLLAINVPGIVLVQIKEAVMGDLFDSVSSAELRTTHIFRAKLKNHTALKGCSSSVSFRCSYKAISEKQMKKLRTAGFTTVPEKPVKGVSGYRIDSLSYLDKSGKLQTISSRDFVTKYNNDLEFKRRINQAYNPRWKMVRDSLGQKVMKKFKVSLQRTIGGSKKAMAAEKKAFVEKGITQGSQEDLNRPRAALVAEEADDAAKKQALDSEAEAKRTLSSLRSKSSGFRGAIGSATRGVNLFTGFQGSACMVIKTAEVTGTMARVLKYAQLMRLFVLMANVADSITYGEATPEAVSFMGDFVTDVDLQEKTIAENSFGSSGNLINDLKNEAGNKDPQLVDNPHYGKSPTDAAGLKASLYGDVRNLDMRESQFMTGAGFNGTLRGITEELRSSSGGTLNRETCAFYENPVVQTGGLLLSLASIVGTGGSAAAAAGVKAVGQAAVFSFAMGYLNGLISDMLNGTISDDSMRGVDVGNALFSGGAAFFGSLASSRGVTPISTNAEVRNMQALKHESQQRHAQLARYEARSEPFNIYNQYSFLGSIAWSLNPTTVQSLSRAGLALRTPQLVFSSLGTLLSPKVQAATISDPSRYNKCEDPAFVGGGVIKSEDTGEFTTSGGVNLQTADIMCNIRYSNDPMHLNVDPSRIADWMIDAGQVDHITGEAITDREKMASILATPRDQSGAITDIADPRDGIAVPNVPLPEGGTNDDALNSTKRSQLSPSDSTNITKLAVSDVLRPDDATLADMGIPLDTPSDKLVTYTPGYQVARLAASEEDIIKNNTENGKNEAYLPPPIGSDSTIVNSDSYQPVKDVRTYAHWLRFCRYGDEDGRTVQIGDGDGLEEPSFARTLLGGIPLAGDGQDTYISDGRECIKSNTCSPGQDPNGADGRKNPNAWNGEDAMRNRCRPPVYDIYSIYHIDKSINDGMEEEENAPASDSGSSGGLADGDARDLARQLADHEHLTWQNGQTTPNLLREFADKGKAVNSCGQEFTIDKLLLQVTLKQLERYTIVANNIGFGGDRSMCDSGMHPAGKAIDINQISVREGDGRGKKTGPTITFGSSEEVDVITQFAIEWMDAANTVDKKAGRSGQIACGGYNLLNKRKPTWEGADGNLHFSDSCNHLHIDVGQR